jgi:hypothetical protein
MTTLDQRIRDILACPHPEAKAAAERLRRRATPLGPADIIRLLSASAAACKALREVASALESDGRLPQTPDALYTSIREAEPERRLWFDGWTIEDGRLFLRLCVHQYEWSPEYGGHLVPRSREIGVPVDEILHMEKRQ